MFNIKLFVDTNAFLQILRRTSKAEKVADMLERDGSELFTSMAVLNEIKHKLLWLEAFDTLKTKKKYKVMKFIKSDQKFRESVLMRYMEFYSTVVGRCTVVSLHSFYELRAVGVMLKYGLLPTDAYILATMQALGISDILTDDNDFSKIEWVNVVGF